MVSTAETLPHSSTSSNELQEARIWQVLHQTILSNPFLQHRRRLNPKQLLFLLNVSAREALYGGAAGGGKTDTALIAAAQYLCVPGYSSLILRRSFAELKKQDSIMQRAKQWWLKQGWWNGSDYRFTFEVPGGPNGSDGESYITFGFLERDDDVYQYDGPAFQHIGIDELRAHTEWRYRYMFSRQRRPNEGPLSQVPLRMHGFTNPGGIGHDWMKKRFLPDDVDKIPLDKLHSQHWWKNGRLFVPARKEDNFALDLESYNRSMEELDPITRAQLDKGDWSAYQGGRFKPEWLMRRWKVHGHEYIVYDPAGERIYHKSQCYVFATLDPAASTKKKADHTCWCIWIVTPLKDLLWYRCRNVKLEVPDILPNVHTDCQETDAKFCTIEDVAFQKGLIQAGQRRQGFPQVVPLKRTQDKLSRAIPAINRCAGGKLYIVEGADWSDEATGQLIRFTGINDAADDIVDNLSDACEMLGTYDSQPNNPGIPRVLRPT